MQVSPAPCEIRVDSVRKKFGQYVAVDDVSFTVQPGRVTGFLGPNGAGKTTTLRMLLGLITPTSGQTLIGGRRYEELEAPSATVGALLEANGFHPGRSGRDHLRTYAGATDVTDSRIDEVLERVGLADAARKHVRGYSLGMRQRLGIAAALLAEPTVLICDEPTNGLDPEGIRWLRGLLRGEAAEGRTVLVSSHLLAEMQHIVDAVVVIDHGRIVFDGDVGAVGAAAVRVTAGDAPGLSAAITSQGDGSAVVDAVGPDTLVVHGLDAARVGELARDAGIALSQLVTEAGSLEDLFFTLTDTGAAPVAGAVR